MAHAFTDWEATCLAHHGIPHQRWGFRRFQNEDGSLTAAGKLRYLKNGNDSSGSNKSKKEKSNKRQYSDEEMNRIKSNTRKYGVIGGFATLYKINKAQKNVVSQKPSSKPMTSEAPKKKSPNTTPAIPMSFANQSKRTRKILNKSGAYALGAVLADRNGNSRKADRYAKKANKYLRRAQKHMH